jgi:hypothetical protein
MAEYSRLASGQVTSVLTGAPTSVILPFIPNYIEISNSTRAAAASGVTRAWWETDMGQGAAFLTTTGAGPADGTSFISAATGGGFSTFSGGLSQQFGPTLAIASMTAANPIVVTTTGNHNLVSGNVVTFSNLYESSTTGLQQIAGMPFVVTVTGATTFSIAWNGTGSNYTAISGSPTTPTPTVKQILFPNLYAPNVGFISALTLAATTTVVTTAPTNIQVGQQVAFRIPSSWGTIQLNSLPDVLIPGSPIYGYVQSVTNATTFVVNINSTGYTAFNPNQAFASFPGENFPQVVAVGDVNSGGYPYTGAQLYPSPAFYNGKGTGTALSINGPSIQGAFANNTSMGFIIGGSISGTTADTIYWRAYLHDLNT